MKDKIFYRKHYYFLIVFVALASVLCFTKAHAQTVPVPDANFRAYLKTAYPAVLNAQEELILAEAEKVTTIRCSGLNIADLSGIENFTALVELYFDNNQVKSLPDFSTLTRLEVLNMAYNDIEETPDFSHNLELRVLNLEYLWFTEFPDLTKNIKLEVLNFSENAQLTAFPDLTKNTNLTYLNFDNNQHINIPGLSMLPHLVYLSCQNNIMRSLPDLSMNTSLKYLICNKNRLNGLPALSNHAALVYLDCSENFISTLPPLTNNTSLSTLICHSNKLASIPDISATALGKSDSSVVNIASNHLTFEDIIPFVNREKFEALSYGGQTFTKKDSIIRKSINTAIEFDVNIDASVPDNIYEWYKNGLLIQSTNNSFFKIDNTTLLDSGTYYCIIKNPNVSDLQLLSGKTRVFIDNETAIIPDANFRNYLKDRYPLIFNSDDKLIIEEAKNVTFIFVHSASIKNISGVEYFSNLKTLYVSNNALTEIPDLSNLKSLETLGIGGNKINTLPDLHGNLALKSLSFENNKITYIPDLSYLVALEGLGFSMNPIQDLPVTAALVNLKSISGNNLATYQIPDFTSNTALETISFSSSKLYQAPDLSKNTKLKALYLDSNPFENAPDLSNHVALETLILSETGIKNLPDLSNLPNLKWLSLNRCIMLRKFPDVSKNVLLERLDLGQVHMDTVLSLSNNTRLWYLNLQGNYRIKHLPSLETNVALTHLYVGGNQIKRLPELKQCTNLSFLSCGNELSALPDLSENVNLEFLGCGGSKLTSLPDLSRSKIGTAQYSELFIAGNLLSFEDLLPLLWLKGYNRFYYGSQKPLTKDSIIVRPEGSGFTIDLNIDDAVTTNTYTWYKDNVLVGETSTNQFAIEAISTSDAGIYRCQIKNPAYTDLILSSGNYTLKVDTLSPPWQPVEGGIENHLVIIPADVSVDIDGSGIEPGDYIGIFFKDENGRAALSGSLKWTGDNNAITVWGKSKDPKNGFDPGESFIVQVWKRKGGKVYTVTATYDNQLPFTHAGEYSNNGFSKILSLKTRPVCQTIMLHKGWNLTATYVKATDLAMSTIFQHKNNIIVKEASGKILYAPEFGITGGIWNILEGYMIYSSSDQTFEVCGRKIDLQTTIPLVKSSYPVFLPYYGDQETAVAVALKGLGNNYSFAQSIEYVNGAASPNAYNYIPSHIINPPIDQIGKMKPGLAYKIVLQNSVLDFRYPTDMATGRKREENTVLASRHFKSGHSGSMVNAVLVIHDQAMEGIVSPGDEIAVLDQDEAVVGAGVYNGAAMAITLWESESMKAMDAFTVRLWDTETDKEYALAVDYARGDGRFMAHTLSIANRLSIVHAAEGDAIQVYPNPVSKIVNFSFAVENGGNVRIVLRDALGSETAELLNETLPAGHYRRTFDLSMFSAGQYFYQMTMPGKIIRDKLLIIKK